MTTGFQLTRNAAGQLVLTDSGGAAHVGVVPARAFAISAPDEGLALVSAEGRELAWIDRLTDLPADIRRLVEEELAGREFMPEIRQLRYVSSFATPSTWTVETDRGETTFVLRGEEDIRRLCPPTMLLIADSHGVHYLIRDLDGMDTASRRLLGRFL